MVVTRPRSNIGATVLRLRSDEQLVALLRTGHDEAFSVIHDRYRARLLAYALQMLRSRQDAEDVLQDVFERAYLSLRRTPEDRVLALRPWLYRIAHNRCIDQLRRPLPPPPESLITLGPQTGDPVVEVDRRDALRRLMVDVGRLPEQQRSALLMRELGGISYADVAEALGVSVPAVKSLLVRARVSLVQAGEARDAACAEIRAELVHAHEIRMRPNARARRHMRDCAGCREFRGDLRGVRRQLLGVMPAAGPLGMLARLLGGGGTGGGAAAAWSGSAATGATGSGILTSSAGLAAGASHVATLVAATVVTAGGAAAIGNSVTAVTHHHHLTARATHRAPALRSATPARGTRAASVAVARTGSAPATVTASPVPGTPVALPPATVSVPVHAATPPAHHASHTHVNVLDPGQQLAPLAPEPGTTAASKNAQANGSSTSAATKSTTGSPTATEASSGTASDGSTAAAGGGPAGTAGTSSTTGPSAGASTTTQPTSSSAAAGSTSSATGSPTTSSQPGTGSPTTSTGSTAVATSPAGMPATSST